MTAYRTSTARISAVLLAAALAATLIGCTDTGSNEPDTPRMPSTSASPTSSAESTNGITMDQAGTIATDKYGGTVKSVEDDSYKGEPAWEVEIKDSTEGSIEVKVSKATGEILDMELDD